MSDSRPFEATKKGGPGKQLFFRKYLGCSIVTICGLFMIALTVSIGAFLIFKGMGTFARYGHSVFEFLFSSDWSPMLSQAIILHKLYSHSLVTL